jgi:hypothetical protein
MHAKNPADYRAKQERSRRLHGFLAGPIQRCGPNAVILRNGERIPLGVLRQAFCLGAASKLP